MRGILFLLLCVGFTAFAQSDPSYRFKLGNVEYTLFIVQNSENKTFGTLHYNLYRIGKAKMIASEIMEITNVASGKAIAESYYNVHHDKIVFYYTENGKSTMERKYQQNAKGLLAFSSKIINIPPPEQVRVDFYNEFTTDPTMVPTVAVENNFEQVDQVAEYPGGINKLRQFLADNIIFPQDEIDNGIGGKMIATFIVEKDGSISTIKIIKSLGSGFDQEVIRVLNKAEKWKPAQLRGEAVRYTFNLPIVFASSE